MGGKLPGQSLNGILVLAALGLFIPGSGLGQSTGAHQSPEQRAGIRYDVQRVRGLVVFDHKRHVAAVNPDPQYPHKTPDGVACIGCHHTVKNVTEARQFQKCASCHHAEGDPRNPEDREGYDLNNREALHRSCIGCHRSLNLVASNERFQNVGFTKCGECHNRDDAFIPAVAEAETQPAAIPDPGMPTTQRVSPAVPNFRTPEDPPRGYAGSSPVRRLPQTTPDYVPVPDRWRIGFPEDPRFESGGPLNPYRQNVLKGDYPIFGQHNFLNVTVESDSLVVGRRLPVPSDVSAQNPDSSEFFGRGNQFFYRQNFSVAVDLSHGDTAFKPPDWRLEVVPNFNINYLRVQENGIVNIDPRKGETRLDGQVALQAGFAEVRLGDTTRLLPFLRGSGSRDGESPHFDSTSLRTGIQPFISDFRGFIFSDVNLGARLFGNFGSNRYQFNAAYFNMLEKDTNSELNRLSFRDQSVYVLNVFRQDTRWKGYTTQFSLHFNNDKPSRRFDKNHFLVRPAFVGDVAEHGVKAGYLGWAGDGHMGRLNISHAFYQVFGADSRNPIAGQRVDINAQMAALELSLDRDWVRFKSSFFWASGDKNPLDDQGRGFDTIFDCPEFVGGKFSFWNSQGIRLTQTGVALVNGDSLLPSLRSSRTEGQPNFVNPGIFIYNAGLEAELTPKLRGILNANYMQFQYTAPIETLLFQPGIRKSIGWDYGVGVLYRPLLSENIILGAGYTVLVPGGGLRDIFSSNCSLAGCGSSSQFFQALFLRLRFAF